MKTLFFLATVLLTIVHAEITSVQQLFNVQTIKVKKISDEKSIKNFGFVRVNQSNVYDVAPRFSGYVEILYADTIYKKVRKGEALAKVYSPEVLKAKDEYTNSLRYGNNKNMINASKEKLKLLDIPNSEINSIKKNRNLTTISSPVSGYIFKKNINNKSAFNAKKTLFEIVNLESVWVEVNIHQDQLPSLKDIHSFLLSTPALTQTFLVKESQLYPALDSKQESFTLRLEVENKQHLLKPGMYMSILMKQKSQNYLTLPTTAVIRKNGVFYAFVVGEYEGEYEPLQIEVEVLNPDTYIVKSGLIAGDEVVNNALFMMDSDAQVNGLY